MSSDPLGLMWRDEWCSSCRMRSSRFRMRSGPAVGVSSSSWGCICCCWRWCCSSVEVAPVSLRTCCDGSQMFSLEPVRELQLRLYSRSVGYTLGGGPSGMPAVTQSAIVFRSSSSLMLPEGVLALLRGGP
uniref:(northern house mosquito) hypothetical protein n=1 Tax=Culex pipiens TaxID=7175 RepID=A0A8D8GAP8_CULPI